MLSSLLSLYISNTIAHTENINFKNLNYTFDLNINNTTQELTENYVPKKDQRMIEPIINSSSAIVLDYETGEILYEKNAHAKLSIASTTKIMTDTIILEENNLEDIATISKYAANQPGSRMGIYTGEKISILNLIYGSLIASGNDASTALAEYNAGSTTKFVEKMNQKAEKLKLVNTHFANPTGLDQADHYSSSYDLAKLSIYAYKNPNIQKIVKTKDIIIHTENNRELHLTNTNELLNSYLNILGFKTGSTENAGDCLISIAENEKNNKIVTVVLNSPNRFQESKNLIDWTFRAYNWK